MRRSISVKGKTYARLKALADREDRSCSGILETLINKHCDDNGIPDDVKPQPKAPVDVPAHLSL